MLLAYVDESYDQDKYWIAALLCPETEIQPLTIALDGVVEKAAGNYVEISASAELHGHSLFHAKDDWAPLRLMPRARIGVYNDAFDVIARHDVEIVIRGVDRNGLEKRYAYPDHPHAVVLSHLLERIDEYAERKEMLVLVIADEVDQAAEYRRDLWRFQRYTTMGYRARQITTVVDTIHFAPSHASRLVQAADLIAYMFFRMRSGQSRDEREKRANEVLWERLQSRVVHVHCWYPMASQ